MNDKQNNNFKVPDDMIKSPFDSWIQFNEEQIDNYLKLMRINALSAEILTFLMKHCDNYNCVIISQKTIAEIFSRSRQTINNAIKVLKEHNFIKIKKTGNGTFYFINSNFIWKSYGTNHRFAEFNAKIIFSRQEILETGLELNKIWIKKGQNVLLSKGKEGKSERP